MITLHTHKNGYNKKIKITNVSNDVRQMGTLKHCLWKCQMTQLGISSERTKMQLPCDSTTPLLDIETEKRCSDRNLYMNIHSSTFTID